MEKIKLSDGTLINITDIQVMNGVLKIVTPDHTVEELAEIFSNKSKTNLITILTVSGKESGFKTGFTSFAGIMYEADGLKTVELFQPVDVNEQRISNAEGTSNAASAMVEQTNINVHELTETVDALLGTA